MLSIQWVDIPVFFILFMIEFRCSFNLSGKFRNFPLSLDYNKELNTIKQIARNNGYRESIIDNMIKNKKTKNS